MKKNLCLLAGALALSTVSLAAQAQEKRNAVSLFGNISSSSDFSQANVSAGYERLITDKLSLAANVTYFQLKAGGSDSNMTSVGLGGTYYVGRPAKASNMLFYGKGVVTFSHMSGGGGSGTGFGAFAGLEQPMGESTSLFEELGYQHTSFDSASYNQVVFNIGLKLRF